MLRIATTESVWVAIFPLCLLFISLILCFVCLLVKRKALYLKPASLTLTCLCVCSQAITLTSRWIVGGHFPVVGRFEAFFFFSFCLVVIYLYLSLRMKEIGVGLIMLLCMGLAFLLPCIWIPKPIAPLTPFLDTPLFFLHVLFSFVGYAMFAAAASLSGEYLIIKDKKIFLWIEHSLSLGFCLFTLCMIAGAIWAYLAWESYWMWNLKGIWSFSVWLYYAGLIHHRFLSMNEISLKHRAVYSIVGFCLTLFTFLGIGLLMKGTHRL